MAIAREAVGELALDDIKPLTEISFAEISDDQNPHILTPRRETEACPARRTFWRCCGGLATRAQGLFGRNVAATPKG